MDHDIATMEANKVEEETRLIDSTKTKAALDPEDIDDNVGLIGQQIASPLKQPNKITSRKRFVFLAIVLLSCVVLLLYGLFANGNSNNNNSSNEEQDDDETTDHDNHQNGDVDEETELIFAQSRKEPTSDSTAPVFIDTNGNELLDLLLNPEKHNPELLTIPSHIDREIERCSLKYRNHFPVDSIGWRIRRADCGKDHDVDGDDDDDNKNDDEWSVVLYGDWKAETIYTSGCRMGKTCPLFPKCTISHVQDQQHHDALTSANVILGAQQDYTTVAMLPNNNDTKAYRVLYWREALWNDVPIAFQQRFHFEMGVHVYAPLLNPNFLRTPSQMLRGIGSTKYVTTPLLEHRKHFAISIMSDCNAPSMRSKYVKMLTSFLGKDKVHRYGKCGNRELPGKFYNDDSSELLISYKFYLAYAAKNEKNDMQELTL
jgi:hypothetical protein